MSEPEIGSREWWMVAGLFSLRGPVDCILRLLEQQEITRAKARELLFYVARVIGGYWMKPTPEESLPDAPWDKLNWCGDAVPDKGDVVAWVDDYENDAIDPQDGKAAAKLARIREAMVKLLAFLVELPPSNGGAYLKPMAQRILQEIDS